jgi:type II secretory pathway pseudopilin PulG
MVELCIVIVVLGILMTTGIAALMRARVASNESSAIGGLRATSSAQVAYSSSCGLGNYAANYVILGTKPSPNSQGFISEDLGLSLNPSRNGYSFAVAMGAGGANVNPDCNNNVTISRYYASARPTILGQTGSRSFAVSQTGSVYQAVGAMPPPEPFGPATPLAQ